MALSYIEGFNMDSPYVPDAGDIVWMDFGPQIGREPAGRRPVLVLTPASYNDKTSLMVCCPITTQIKNYPFEVVLSGTAPSAVISDQVKSLDWRKRHASRLGVATPTELAAVHAKIRVLLGLE
jgi:mRNA interferase MazF